MIHPKAARLRLCLTIVAVAAFAALLPAAASADVTPSVSTNYEFNTPAAHGFYEITQTFQYGPTAEPTGGTEDLRKWIIDSPAGLIGNPNAVPWADRCTPEQFEPVTGPAGQFVNSTCPASAKVGTATVLFVTDAMSGFAPAGTQLPPTNGDIYVLQTDPEVPTTLATRLNSAVYQPVPGTPCAAASAVSPCPVYPKTKSVVAPVTSGPDGDFRLRTIAGEDSQRAAPLLPTGAPPAAPFGAGPTPVHIRSITYHLNGVAPSGIPFITYPPNCGPWNSLSYATAYDSNTNADYDPDPDPTHNEYKRSTNVDVKIPDCSTKPAFAPKITTGLSTVARDSNPQVDVVVENPGVPGTDLPAKIVNTLPASMTVDVQGIGNLCEIAQRDAGACPPASQVGTVSIETPMIGAGLTGKVYMTRSSDAIPDLTVFVTGAISFRMDATTVFVGPRGNQIQTTFDNLPQVPFSKFTLSIAGGQDSLLTISKCPDNTRTPEDGPISYAVNSYAGQTANMSQTFKFENCHGVTKITRTRCARKAVRVSPSYASRSEIKYARLYINGHRVQTSKRSPYRFKAQSVKKYKQGRKRIIVRAFYKDKTVSKRSTVFRVCGTHRSAKSDRKPAFTGSYRGYPIIG